jgi:pyridoxine kinase
VFGAAGNSAAVFPLQRLGREVWAVNTVEFSNHTGYGAWRGRGPDAALAGELVRGLEERGVLGRCEAVLTGYLGSAEVGAAAADAVRRVKARNTAAVYCCDPVMGDDGPGIYVKPDIPRVFSELLVPLADIITPNRFELELLSGMRIEDEAGALAAIDAMHAAGPRVVLLTSVRDGKGTLGMIASEGTERWRIRTPELRFASVAGVDDTSVSGTGDLCAALFLSAYLDGAGVRLALERTASALFGVLRTASEAGSRELMLAEAQDELVNPAMRFTAERAG